jgi:hypothetical protein
MIVVGKGAAGVGGERIYMIELLEDWGGVRALRADCR